MGERPHRGSDRREARRPVAVGGARQNFAAAARCQVRRCADNAVRAPPRSQTARTAAAGAVFRAQAPARSDQSLLSLADRRPGRDRDPVLRRARSRSLRRHAVLRLSRAARLCDSAPARCRRQAERRRRDSGTTRRAAAGATPLRLACSGAPSGAAPAMRRPMRKRPTDDSQRHDAQCDDSQRDASQRSAAGHDNADAPLDERAVAAARAELRGERTGILGATGRLSLPRLDPPRRVPERWSFIHVMDRLEEAFRILRRLPISTRPRGYVTSMPFHVYDRADLNAQLETYELERLARLRNRVRIPPSPAEIARMEEALRWPAQFLSGAEYHHVARAVNLGCLWAAADTDIDKALRRIKLTQRTFNARKLQGLRIIARELIRRRVSVR